MAYKSIHLPVGYQVAIKADTDPDWVDLGVTKDSGTLEFTYDAIKVTGSQAEAVLNYVKNMTMNASFSLYQQDLKNIDKIMSGATSYTVTDGVLVPDYQQTAAVGWARETFIPFTKQNASGAVPGNITVNNPGALVLGTDYIVTKSGDKWGIIILAARGNLANVLLLEYDYTPAASRNITAGASAVDIQPRALRIRKLLDAANNKYWTCIIYAATATSGLSFSLPRYDEDEPNSLEVQMEGQLDTTRSTMDQLFTIIDEFGTEDI